MFRRVQGCVICVGCVRHRQRVSPVQLGQRIVASNAANYPFDHVAAVFGTCVRHLRSGRPRPKRISGWLGAWEEASRAPVADRSTLADSIGGAREDAPAEPAGAWCLPNGRAARPPAMHA